MPSQHAKLSPSAAARWLACPGSVALSANVPSTSSRASDEGTAGHSLFEKAVRLGKSPALWLGEKFNEVKVTQEMVSWVTEAVEWVTDYLAANPGSVVYSEEKVNIGPALGLPGDVLWGTCDLFIMSKKELVVFDLKLGFVDVQPQDNPQLNLYALGFLAEVGPLFDTVRLVIHQPRSGGAKETVMSVDEMLAIQAEYAPKAALALTEGAPLNATPKGCTWCPVAGTCPKLQEENIKLARSEFGPASIETLSMEQLLLVLDKADIIEQAIAAARSHALRLITLGQPLPGWKVVTGKTRDAWKSEAEAAPALEKLGLDPWEKSLVSPAAARDALAEVAAKSSKTKKAAKELAVLMLAPLVHKPEGRPTLVRDTDSRPALGAEFTVIE